jgi:hypothetical protein
MTRMAWYDTTQTSGRIAALSSLSRDNFEAFQFVHYEEDDFYSSHHDFGTYQLNFPSGPRILTSLIYLNDVEQGGETFFPQVRLLYLSHICLIPVSYLARVRLIFTRAPFLTAHTCVQC